MYGVLQLTSNRPVYDFLLNNERVAIKLPHREPGSRKSRYWDSFYANRGVNTTRCGHTEKLMVGSWHKGQEVMFE